MIHELDTDIILTRKDHCKIAGRGAEYILGIAKIMFRKENTTLNNEKRVNNLKKRVFKIMHNIPIDTVQHCS